MNEVLELLRRDHEKMGITLLRGASEFAIADFEKTMGIRLPDDFRRLYQLCNGFKREEDIFKLVTLTYSLSDFLFLLFKKGVFDGLYARMDENAT